MVMLAMIILAHFWVPVTQLLDMPTVWSERARSISHIMVDNPLSPIVWGGDLNVHLGNAPGGNGRHRAPLHLCPTASQSAYAKPFLDALGRIPNGMTVLNGLEGAPRPTYYHSHEAAACASETAARARCKHPIGTRPLPRKRTTKSCCARPCKSYE
jgi:hypothetical protein